MKFMIDGSNPHSISPTVEYHMLETASIRTPFWNKDPRQQTKKNPPAKIPTELPLVSPSRNPRSIQSTENIFHS